MQKYCEIPKNDVKAKAENAWFQTCRKNNTPFITVKARTKFADVDWDYIAYAPEVDKVLNAGNGQVRDGAIAIFKKYANPKSQYEANDLIVRFANLEIPQAKLAAEELYDFIVGYLKNSRQVEEA